MLYKNEYFMVYPVYFDRKKTVNQGRKWNKDLTIDNPTFKELLRATTELKYSFLSEPTKKHPRNIDNPGRILIMKKHGRKEAIKSLCEFIKKERELRKINECKSQVQNTLNLVPRKKNKKKNNKF
ncbi:Signal recognition particle SEC65 subunit [Nucleospora cyclopteri]